MDPAATARGLRAIDRELRRLGKESVPADELSGAKEGFGLSLLSQFNNMRDLTRALSELAVFDLPLDEYDTLEKRIESLRDADLLRVARQYFDPDRMRFIVVGDWRAMSASLRELGWGPIELRDTWGRVLRVENP